MDVEEEYNSDGAGSEEALCTDTPPPPSPTMLGYCEGSTQFAMWEYYQE